MEGIFGVSSEISGKEKLIPSFKVINIILEISQEFTNLLPFLVKFNNKYNNLLKKC
jgi:hypothetical protein